MENKELDIVFGTQPTGLTFEIDGDDSTGLRFEAEIEPVPQESIAPTTSVEIEIGESTPKSSVEFAGDTYDRPGYVPRFTEVSENFRMRDDIRYRERRPTPTVTTVGTVSDEASDIDPTSEALEEKRVRSVIVTQGDDGIEMPKDESITIIKFASPKPEVLKESEPEELDISDILAPLQPEPEQETVEEISADEPQSAEEHEAHDELWQFELDDSIHLVDYTEYDGDSESLSPEEAPLERDNHVFGEYTTPSQRDYVKDGFLDKLMSIRIRLVAASILGILMLVLDVMSFVGFDVFSAIGITGLTTAYNVTDAMLSVAIFTLALPEVLGAIKQLIHKTMSPELILIPSVIVVVLHASIIFATSGEGYLGYGLFVALASILAIIGSYYRVSADFESFKIISKNAIKNILDKRLTRTLARENLALDGAIDEYKSKIARMFRTTFISDFFSRSDKRVENSRGILLMAIASLGVALVVGIVSYFVGVGSVAEASSSFALVFLLSFPSFTMLSHKMSYRLSSLECSGESSAFVGESSIYSSSDIDVIAYEDTEIFGEEDVTIKKMDVYGGHSISRVMSDMRAVFSIVGGPLERVFRATIDDADTVATDVHIEDDGIVALVDDRRILVGTKDFMSRYRISVAEGDYRTSSVDSTKVMYGAVDGEMYVRFIIRYSFSEEFTMLLPHLKAEGIVPLVYTRDPNITGEFVKLLALSEDVIRVMKKPTPKNTDDKVYRRVSAGIVTLGNKASAINMVLLAKKYIVHQDNIALTEIIAMISGAVIASLFAVGGSLAVPAVAFLTLQIAWCIYLSVRTHLAFPNQKQDKEN